LGTLEIMVLAIALAIDAFSVAASIGSRCCPRFGSLRLALSFGGFQGVMPLLGALAGSLLYVFVSKYDHWLAFGLLELVGIKMLYEGLRKKKEDVTCSTNGASFDPSCGWSLLGLSIATSIDAFGAGIVMQMRKTNLWLAAACIAITAFVLTYLGAKLGHQAEKRFGRAAEITGGLVLIALGIKMLAI
jgi:manganese efflux pump family protein